MTSDVILRGGADASAAPIAGGAAVPSNADFRLLADFRHYLRRFLAFSDAAIGAAGLRPSQYQALLAIRALGDEGAVTTSALAVQMCIKLNSAVELIDRLILAGLIERSRAADDRRRTELRLTPEGAAALEPLAAVHLAHHRAHLPHLIETMAGLDTRPQFPPNSAE